MGEIFNFDPHKHLIMKHNTYQKLLFFSLLFSFLSLSTKAQDQRPNTHLYPNGKLKFKRYLSEDITTIYESWYPTKQLRAKAKGLRILTEYYHPNGQIGFKADSMLEDGRKAIFRWDAKGQVRSEIYFTEGKAEGKQAFYYANGQASLVGQNAKGLMIGSWTLYDSSGHVIKTVEVESWEEEKRASDPSHFLFYSFLMNPGREMFYYEVPPAFGEYVKAEEEPRPLNMYSIKKKVGYPKLARRKKIDGLVVLRILVDAKGKGIFYVSVADASPLLIKAVEDHILDLKFSPATFQGEAIPFWVNIPFGFKFR